MASTTLLEYYDRIETAAAQVVSRLGRADVAIVLGSGLSSFSSRLRSAKTLSYEEIPQMPRTTVPGHRGELIIGELPTKSGAPLRILCFSGRVHWYEGFSFDQVNFLVRLAAACGCSCYVLTNSAGGAIPRMKPGSAMIITDHIRFTRVDPLRDDLITDDGRPKTQSDGVYSQRLIKLAKEVAEDLGQTVYEGVYCWCGGPSYETPAEVQAAMKMGADAFGMSTVPEALAGRALGLEIFGISLCTNMACGLQQNEKLLHADVVRIAKESGPEFEQLLVEFFYNFDPAALVRREVSIALAPDQRLKSGRRRLLPVPGFWSGSAAVDSDAEFVKSFFKRDSFEIAIFVDEGPDSNEKAIDFDDLPALMTVSPNAAGKGRLFFRSDRIVIELATRILDIESHHLIGVLCRLGVKRIIQVVSASGDGPFYISDIVDLGSDRVYPGFSPSLKRLDCALFRPATLCVFPGPPTPTETKLTTVFNTPLYTSSSLSPVYAGLHANLACSVIAGATLSDLDHEEAKSENGPLLWDRERPALPYRNYVQERVDQVRVAAAEIKGVLLRDRVELALVLDSALNAVTSHLKLLSSLAVETVQNWKQDLGRGWTLSLAEWRNGKRVLCLHYTGSEPPLPLYDSTFAIRVFKALEIETVVFVGAGISAQNSIPIGSVVGVADHVNCSGENPLFGPNRDEFGPRFPDVAGMYAPVPCRTVVVGYQPNTAACSAVFAEHLGIQVYCSNLIPEALVARHSAMSIFMLLWISASCVSYESVELGGSALKEITTSLTQILS